MIDQALHRAHTAMNLLQNRADAAELALARLWDAISWLNDYDPGAVEDMEDKWRISLESREVFAAAQPAEWGVTETEMGKDEWERAEADTHTQQIGARSR